MNLVLYLIYYLIFKEVVGDGKQRNSYDNSI